MPAGDADAGDEWDGQMQTAEEIHGGEMRRTSERRRDPHNSRLALVESKEKVVTGRFKDLLHGGDDVGSYGGGRCDSLQGWYVTTRCAAI